MITTKFLSSILSFLLLSSLFAPSFAQGASSKKSKGKAESCDGAADIVPVKPMSFARKRKPAPKEQMAEVNHPPLNRPKRRL
ncbi:MAG: hypothetical protein ACREEM_54965 [Blastocatellia bacterium]